MTFENLLKEQRIIDKTQFDINYIESLIKDKKKVILQFSKAIYTKEILEEINRYALLYGRNIEVRFYGHYSSFFDASVLQYIPDAQCVSIDCLRSSVNIESICALKRLVEFSLGIYDLDIPNILANEIFSKLEHLRISETKKTNFDLDVVGKLKNLKSLYISGHSKHIESLNDSNLTTLRLRQMPKKVSLSFITSMANIENLGIFLGGRENIDEISNDRIRNLEIALIRGLSSLGNLDRFPNMESLHVEDQIRLNSISFNKNIKLKELKVINCKSLINIYGIEKLQSLHGLRIFKSSIDYNEFKSSAFPDTLKTIGFYTVKSKLDSKIKEDLKLKGYSEFD